MTSDIVGFFERNGIQLMMDVFRFASVTFSMRLCLHLIVNYIVNSLLSICYRIALSTKRSFTYIFYFSNPRCVVLDEEEAGLTIDQDRITNKNVVLHVI